MAENENRNEFRRKKKFHKKRPHNDGNRNITEELAEELADDLAEEQAAEAEEPVKADVPEAEPEVKPVEQPKEQEKNGIEAYAVTVKLRHGRGYFDDNGLNVKEGDMVIADTGNGCELAEVYLSARNVVSNKIVLPLPKIIRPATKEDIEKSTANGEKEVDAFNRCLSIIEKSALPMKLVDAEYSFDCSRLTFYFTAEDRVDFRDLVKELASVFKTRIDLRQIGIRDENRMIGGLGVCGRPFCCSMFQPECNQISIKMAKEQGLSLNSAKISGACNRLMCCLRYESDFYKSQLAVMPKVNSYVATPDGDGVVADITPLDGTVKVYFENDKTPHIYKYTDITVKARTKKDAEAAMSSEAKQNK